MSQWYSQYYKLIHKPRYIYATLFLRNHNQFIPFINILRSELNTKSVVRNNRKFHIIQTTITRHTHSSFRMKIQLKGLGNLFHR